MIMKYNKKYNFFGWLSVSALLMATACADNADLYMSQVASDSKNIVTLTVEPPSQLVGTRASGDESAPDLHHISDGSKVDILIYALYEESNGTYTLVTDDYETGANKPEKAEGVPEGQTRINLTQADYPHKIQLTLAEGKKYMMVFWAQNSTTLAYDTKDLRQVEVKYDNAKNNDELRDAFCTSVPIDGKTRKYTAILKRPFAQINVGTTGWDYEGAAELKPSAVSYTHSQITLKDVAKYYDVLKEVTLESITGEDGQSVSGKTDATFKYDWLPAFINVEDKEQLSSYKPVNEEEYLRVHVYGKDKKDYYPYKGWDVYKPYRNNPETEEAKDALKTETYKYLSMCYVLVPEANAIESGTADDATFGYVIPSIKFEAKGIEPKNDDKKGSGDDEENGKKMAAIDNIEQDGIGIGEVFTISNVPAQKNWRTNILSDSFFTFPQKFSIDIVPEYCGDYNYNGDNDYNQDGEKDGTIEAEWPIKYKETYTVTFNGKKIESSTGEERGTIRFDQWETPGKTLDYHNKFINGDVLYNGITFTSALKLNSSVNIQFTTLYHTKVYIVQSVWEEQGKEEYGEDSNKTYKRTIKFDNEELPIVSATTPADSKNVRLYTLDVSAGTHSITKGSGESGLLYLEVKTYDILDDTIDEAEYNK